MAEKLVGRNYLTPDLVAKVTGRAKYAEDFRADGMLFTKLLVSPMPHARVRSIDTRAALAMPGVKAILTADDLPVLPGGVERALTNEPLYAGEPILAVAAVDELTAAEAIERIQVDLEPLPFVVDPLDSLRPGGPNSRTNGNAWGAVPPNSPPGTPAPLETIKWTEQDFDEEDVGQLPTGKALEEWSVGDIDAGFKNAALVLDETFVVQSTGHHPMETRSAMAYWQNGKLYIHVSTQSVAQTQPAIARWVGIDPSQVVLICEYTGGGFGSKGGGAVSMSIPALLSKKANAPVMMRISREEESFIGRARTNMSGRVKMGFAKDGRITALDLFIVQDSGAYGPMGDHRSAGLASSLIYQPPAMRWRAVNVLTNTPPRSQQRSPGPMQANGLIEPVISKAARQLGIDQVEIRSMNSPSGKASFGPVGPNGQRQHITSAFIKEGLARGAQEFNWSMRKARASQRQGSKIRGVGVAVGPHGAGSIGWDSIMTIRPDGKLYVQSGVGNLGTHSLIDLARVAADVLAMPWEKVEVIWGDTSKGLPWTCLSVGSQTTHAMTRANHAGAMDARRKLQEIAARDLGGAPGDYELGNERVYRQGNPGRGLSYAQAARRAIELGGKFDGHELPTDINPMTKGSATRLAGLGLMGVAKDNYPRDGATYSFVIGFAEVEIDVETGKATLVDYLGVGDVGTVVNPRSLLAQIKGGSCLGIAHALFQKSVMDPQYGHSLARRFHYSKPLTILDVPATMHASALDIPDPETPVGARGVGEPPVGAGYGAVMNAISDALGDDIFRRAPVTADLILMSLENGRPMHEPLRELTSREISMAVIRDVMPVFELFQPTSVADAQTLLNRYGSNAWVLAGGLDSLDWLKDRIKRPQAVIDLQGIAELKGIRPFEDGLEIGAMTTLTEIVRHPVVRERYKILLDATESAASPQIRNQGTVGGNVSQDTRCWYYRAGWSCYRAGGNICYADTPQAINREHAILEADRCVAVNPSDTAPALIALDARMVVRTSSGEQVVAAEDYFVGPGTDITRMTILQPGDLLTAIRIPATWAGSQFYFEKIRDRQVWDFALVSVASAMVLQGTTIERMRLVVNGVAARPLRLTAVEDLVRGKPRNEATAMVAGNLAIEGAQPLRFNAYKVPLMRNLVKRAIRGVEEATWAS